MNYQIVLFNILQLNVCALKKTKKKSNNANIPFSIRKFCLVKMETAYLAMWFCLASTFTYKTGPFSLYFFVLGYFVKTQAFIALFTNAVFHTAISLFGHDNCQYNTKYRIEIDRYSVQKMRKFIFH